MNNSAKLAAIYDLVPQVNCKGLCSESCGPILLTAFEQQRVESALGTKPKIKGADCPVLFDGKCQAYEARPIICRLWGAVEEMACPHGCRPDVWLTDAQARAMLADVRGISHTIVSIDGMRQA